MQVEVGGLRERVGTLEGELRRKEAEATTARANLTQREGELKQVRSNSALDVLPRWL